MIIGICGPKGSGKSTLAALLHERYNFDRVAFANGIKAMLQALFEYQGIRNERTRRMLWEDLKEEPSVLLAGQTPRFAMQTLGTEWGRQLIGPDLWLQVWVNKARTKAKVVCEDVRHQNEVNTIRDLGGTVLEIRRYGFEYSGEHSTELGGLRPDHLIINNGGPVGMLEQAEMFLNLLPEPKTK